MNKERNPKRILIAGCGRLGTQLGLDLVRQNHLVWGLRRHPRLLPESIRPLQADLSTGQGLSCLPPSLDYVFYVASSGAPTKQAYKAAYSDGISNLIEALVAQDQQLSRLFFVSSTGVYSQQTGEWVDEGSSAQAGHATGKYLLEGEARIRNSPYPGTVIRLAGIYGPGRTRLLDKVIRGEEACPDDRIQYTNLIHLADCTAMMNHLMYLPRPEEIYLGCDCEPVDRCVLLRWLATKLNAPEPRTVPAASLSPRLLRSNKRCSNRRLLDSGFTYSYPTFRDGYGPLIKIYQSRRA